MIRSSAAVQVAMGWIFIFWALAPYPAAAQPDPELLLSLPPQARDLYLSVHKHEGESISSSLPTSEDLRRISEIVERERAKRSPAHRAVRSLVDRAQQVESDVDRLQAAVVQALEPHGVVTSEDHIAALLSAVSTRLLRAQNQNLTRVAIDYHSSELLIASDPETVLGELFGDELVSELKKTGASVERARQAGLTLLTAIGNGDRTGLLSLQLRKESIDELALAAVDSLGVIEELNRGRIEPAKRLSSLGNEASNLLAEIINDLEANQAHATADFLDIEQHLEGLRSRLGLAEADGNSEESSEPQASAKLDEVEREIEKYESLLRRRAEDLILSERNVRRLFDAVVGKPTQDLGQELLGFPNQMQYLAGAKLLKIEELAATLENDLDALLVGETKAIGRIAGIARRLGVDTALDIGGGKKLDVTDVAMMTASGNYVSAAMSIVNSLFAGSVGGGSGDPAVRRQLAEIQHQLADISRKLHSIDAKLDRLTELVEGHHREVMARFDDLHFNLEIMRRAQLSAFQDRFRDCNVAKEHLLDGQGSPRYRSYRDLRPRFRANARAFWSCYAEVRKATVPGRVASDYTLLFRFEGSDARRIWERSYAPSFDLFRQLVASEDIKPSLLVDLDPTVDSVRTRSRTIARVQSEQLVIEEVVGVHGVDAEITGEKATGALHLRELVYEEAFSDATFLIDTQALEELVGYMHFAYPLALFAEDIDSRRLAPAHCVTSGMQCVRGLSERLATQEIDLQASLTLFNTALAQRALLDGHILLPVLDAKFHRLWSEPDPDLDDARKSSLLRILGEEPILAHNFTLYVLRESLRNEAEEEGVSLALKGVAYTFAWMNADVKYLNLLFSMPEEAGVFVDVDEGENGLVGWRDAKCANRLVRGGRYWKLLNTLCIPVPEPAQLASGELERSREWARVAALRDEILDELTSRSLAGELPPGLQTSYANLTVAAHVLHRNETP